MGRRPQTLMRKVLEYDSSSHRLWIVGQRCHHGALGSIVATTAFGRLLSGRIRALSHRRRLVAVGLAGSALIAHDWKDRSVWFRRGRGV
jgi:hypothetical protein